MEHEKPLASENVISSLESGKWTISHHLTWSGSCPALVIQRDEQSMLPPASLKLPEMLKKGIFKTVIYSVSIYIIIRKVALNKAKHHFAYIFFNYKYPFRVFCAWVWSVEWRDAVSVSFPVLFCRFYLRVSSFPVFVFSHLLFCSPVFMC